MQGHTLIEQTDFIYALTNNTLNTGRGTTIDNYYSNKNKESVRIKAYLYQDSTNKSNIEKAINLILQKIKNSSTVLTNEILISIEIAIEIIRINNIPIPLQTIDVLFQQIQQNTPNKPYVYLNYAKILFRHNKLAKVEEMIKTSIQIYPYNTISYQFLFALCEHQSNIDLAINMKYKIFDLNPFNLLFHKELILLLRQYKLNKEAEQIPLKVDKLLLN